jgi:ankyrin repeat protein
LALIDFADKAGILRFRSVREEVYYWKWSPFSILSSNRDDLILKLLGIIGHDKGLAAWLSGPDLDPAVHIELLGPFLVSPARRQLLTGFIEKHPLFHQWVFQTAVLFSLIEKKEKSILVEFLRINRGALLRARDKEGNSLLHRLCFSHGLIAGIASVLLRKGFDPMEKNDAGETALAIAERRGDKKLMNLFQAYEKLPTSNPVGN